MEVTCTEWRGGKVKQWDARGREAVGWRCRGMRGVERQWDVRGSEVVRRRCSGMRRVGQRDERGRSGSEVVRRRCGEVVR